MTTAAQVLICGFCRSTQCDGTCPASGHVGPVPVAIPAGVLEMPMRFWHAEAIARFWYETARKIALEKEIEIGEAKFKTWDQLQIEQQQLRIATARLLLEEMR